MHPQDTEHAQQVETGKTRFANDPLALAQFQTIRTEIEQTKQRLFKILSAGIFSIVLLVPGTKALAVQFSDLGVFLLGMPFLTLLYALIYVAETRALMRAGQYIRNELEPHFDFKGWETWLEDTQLTRNELGYRRSHDVIMFWGFTGFCGMSYVLAVYYAYTFYLEPNFDVLKAAIAVATYILVGGSTFLWALYNAQLTTETT